MVKQYIKENWNTTLLLYAYTINTNVIVGGIMYLSSSFTLYKIIKTLCMEKVTPTIHYFGFNIISYLPTQNEEWVSTGPVGYIIIYVPMD
jgi:hypothetical protein